MHNQLISRTSEKNKIGEIIYAFIIGYVASIAAYYILSQITLPQTATVRADLLVSLAAGFFDVIIIGLTSLLILYRLEHQVSLFLGFMLPLLVNSARTMTLWLIDGSQQLWQVMLFPNVFEMWIIASLLGAASAYLISGPIGSNEQVRAQH